MISYVVGDIFAYMLHYISLYVFRCVDTSEGQVLKRNFVRRCVRPSIRRSVGALVRRSSVFLSANFNKYDCGNCQTVMASSSYSKMRLILHINTHWSVGHFAAVGRVLALLLLINSLSRLKISIIVPTL